MQPPYSYDAQKRGVMERQLLWIEASLMRAVCYYRLRLRLVRHLASVGQQLGDDDGSSARGTALAGSSRWAKLGSWMMFQSMLIVPSILTLWQLQAWSIMVGGASVVLNH